MTITPPRPLRQVQALLPRELTSTLARRIDVQIRAFVDANGKVTKTEIVENTLQNSTDRFFATAALQAAKLWTFTPAMRGAEKISDVIVLQFTFGTGKVAAQSRAK
jgi:TonB family protein